MSLISLTQALTSAQQTEFLNVMIQSLTRSQLSALYLTLKGNEPTIRDVAQHFTEDQLHYIITLIKAKCNYSFDGSKIADDYEW